MYSLLTNISGQPFEKFISFCFENADVFSLTKSSWPGAGKSNEFIRVMQLLSPYHTNTVHTNHWFCYRVPEGYDIEIYLFTATAESKRIILEQYDSLFYQDKAWDKPEDLCFFQNGRLTVGSVSHERICFLYPQTKEWMALTELCGTWEEVPDEAEEQIKSELHGKQAFIVGGRD